MTSNSSMIKKAKLLNSKFNSVDFWKKRVNEFSIFQQRKKDWDANETPNKKPVKKLRVAFDGDVTNQTYLLQMMVEEQVLLFCANALQVDTEIFELFKLQDKNLYQRLWRKSKDEFTNVKKTNGHLFIAATIRLVFKMDTTSLDISTDVYDSILKRISWFTGARTRKLDAKTVMQRRYAGWYQIREFREHWNEFCESNAFSKLQQIGLSKNQQLIISRFNKHHSILTHFGLLRQKNRQLVKDLRQNAKISDELQKLAANKFLFKQHAKGSYSTETIFKTIHDSSTLNIPAAKWKTVGETFYDFAPPEIIQMLPKLMSNSSISRYQRTVQNWYEHQITEFILADKNKVVNYALDAATLRSLCFFFSVKFMLAFAQLMCCCFFFH